jgi:hypothetical protein
MANRYSVPLKYLVTSNSYLNFEFEGKIKVIAVTYTGKPMTKLADIFMSQRTRDVISIFYLLSFKARLTNNGLSKSHVIFILNHGATTLSTMTLSLTTFGKMTPQHGQHSAQ